MHPVMKKNCNKIATDRLNSNNLNALYYSLENTFSIHGPESQKNIYEGCDAAPCALFRVKEPTKNVIFAHHFIPNFNILPLP